MITETSGSRNPDREAGAEKKEEKEELLLHSTSTGQTPVPWCPMAAPCSPQGRSRLDPSCPQLLQEGETR